ncbi:hypothetical protein JCM3263A_24140 [Thermobifida fusca]|jgi:hypothetical protein|uniref:DoxX family membrane protein n=2 Tax=Thermobifida fusca TaxID=2021 RepID=A0A9P2TDM0_THEFU|nr:MULTISPECIES: hypothetical protein [Thermobifida]AAZ54380.1 putative membrane protein [Thermobifida fusca YX]EOR72599.1 hypothetical protein TM51_02045 [Thermobifida fusca TM51]MBO2529759.1 hypothetical protein [Thermobifida sp.]MDD6793362.1 hypothetical protein [Thermobifida fusca]PPS95527.1 membrane protein [Thermobifida fusca]
MAFRIAHLPIRLAAGAYILNSGLNKREADADTAAYLHSAASRVLPTLRDMPPEKFTRMLSNSEIGLGAALLLPLLPSALVGAALTVFGAGLLGHYFTEPGARMEDGIRPTPQGLALAKDVWLVGMGLTLLIDGMRPPCPVR